MRIRGDSLMPLFWIVAFSLAPAIALFRLWLYGWDWRCLFVTCVLSK